MYQYVSQYVINLHNLRIKQYVPICITICNQSTYLKDKTICTNMYQYVSQYVINLHNLRINHMYQYVSQYVINLHNLRIKQYVPICTNMYHNM